LAGLRRAAAQVEGDMAIDEATVKRLEHDLELRTVRAPVSGRVEEVVPFRVGAVVRPAEKLATIVPPGDSRTVAFLPVVAVGRVQPGQPARLRLDGFPWTQYGSLRATVTGVGNEPNEEMIRVELTVEPHSTSRIPLQHGQTGSVEIAVEHASPALLVLRAAGQYLMTPRPASAS
jgi:membrane fusion protein (multidrug efflux system)